MEIKQSQLHPSFEDDATIHNRMMETMGYAIEKRIASSYEFDASLKAIKAIALLIEAKANKQRGIIEMAVEESK
jgi:hypothetical protein